MALISVVGDAQTVLLDDQYTNMCVYAQGVATFAAAGTSTGSAGGRAYVTVQITPGQLPMIAFNSTFPVAQRLVSIQGNLVTFSLMCAASGIGRTAEYYVFYLPKNVPDAKGLLQIYNENASLVFDSSLKYARILGTKTIDYHSGTQSHAFPTNKKLAVCSALVAGNGYKASVPGSAPIGYRDVQVQSAFLEYYVGNGVVYSEQVFDFARFYRESATSALNPWTAYSLKGYFLVLDVTGY